MFLEMSFKSAELGRDTSVCVVIPEACIKSGKPYKTLWLLHGLSGDHRSWMRKTSIERYASRHEIAVVMPGVERSWYTNTAYGANYFNFVSEELPRFCRSVFGGMSDRREDNLVGGLSMGGYGAVKLALSCPENYFACISLSGSLDITRKGRPCNLPEWKSIFDFELEDPLTLEGSEHDLFALASKRREEGAQLPMLYLWCGEQDALLRVNDEFDRHLTELGFEHVYETSEGDHSWKWWDMHICDGLRFALGDKQ